MGYFEEKKAELEDLLATLYKEESDFKYYAEKEKEQINDKTNWYNKLKEGIEQMAKERQIGFPWLARAYEELFLLRDKKIISYLKNKKRPAIRASEIVKEQTQLKREAIRDKKIAEYLVAYYENIAPFLVELKEEVDIASEKERELLKEYTDEELEDKATHYLTKIEYRKLSTTEKNQLALDRFKKRHKSKWLIGRMYERYVGYLFEKKGYDVEYVGIFKGFEDLGRDLLCSKGNNLVIIQCKNWSKFKTIYEKHIFQFFGTVFQYKDENPTKKVRASFYATTKVSDLARRFAKELKIELKENFKYDENYPCIKCNISRVNKEKIYHLPFDQQYDKVKIEPEKGEFYCLTVKEAENNGFRRAFRYKGYKT